MKTGYVVLMKIFQSYLSSEGAMKINMSLHNLNAAANKSDGQNVLTSALVKEGEGK